MENKAKEKRRKRRMSYRAAARELGVDVGHLWHVLHGDRASKRLTLELRKRGIEVEGWAK